MKTRARPAGPPAATVRPSGGVGRGSSPAAEAVSDALRRGDDPFLRARRRTAVLQTCAAATLGGVGLYQFGVLRSVPEPSLPGLDADRVDASGGTYLFAEQVTRHKRICSWCTASAGLLLATVPTVRHEARAAWRALRQR
jgi:hypothetical protein